MRPGHLLIVLLAAAVAEEEEQTCGCSAGRDSAKISDQKKPVTEIRVRETVAEDTSIQYKNLTENACSGDRNYEGYVVGCIYSYSDKYTGRTDCGEQKISGGTFRMGSENYGESGLGKHDIERRYRDNSIHGINRGDAEDPIRQVDVKTFYIDRCEVTNQQFLDFVEARGYVSDAELYNWSFVMEPFIKPELLASDPGRVEGAKWWRAIEGASWKHPEGPGSSIYSLPTWYGKPTPGIPNTPAGDRLSHPVSHISWRDAYNFCRWRGKRLPTEAEYEYALRGGLDQKIFAWGDELYPEGKHLMNVWQGDFSAFENTAEDGSRGTNKVASYPPNGFGVYDLTGNIWEWVYDDFVTGTRQSVAEREETHGSSSTSARVSHKAKRGGSHMCHARFVFYDFIFY